MKKLLLTLIFIFIPLVCHGATSITILVTPNMEDDLAGYKLYEKQGTVTSTYVLLQDMGNTLSYTFTIPDGVIRTYVLTAYDLSDNESDYGNEMTTIDKPPLIPTGTIIQTTVIVQ